MAIHSLSARLVPFNTVRSNGISAPFGAGFVAAVRSTNSGFAVPGQFDRVPVAGRAPLAGARLRRVSGGNLGARFTHPLLTHGEVAGISAESLPGALSLPRLPRAALDIRDIEAVLPTEVSLQGDPWSPDDYSLPWLRLVDDDFDDDLEDDGAADASVAGVVQQEPEFEVMAQIRAKPPRKINLGRDAKGKDIKLEARPLSRAAVISPVAISLRSQSADEHTGLRTLGGHQYISIKDSTGKDVFVRVEFDAVLGSWRVQRSQGVAEPVRFMRRTGQWVVDFEPWVNRATDDQLLSWMFSRPEQVRMSKGDRASLLASLAEIGITRDDLVSMARGGKDLLRMAPALASAWSDHLPRVISAQLRNAQPVRTGDPAVRNLLQALLAKDLNANLAVFEGGGAGAPGSFKSAFDANGRALTEARYRELKQQGDTCLEIQQLKPSVFHVKGARDASVDLIAAAHYAKLAPTFAGNPAALKAQVAADAAAGRRRLATAMDASPQQAMVDVLLPGLLPERAWGQPGAQAVRHLFALKRAMNEASAPLSMQMEHSIITRLQEIAGRVPAIEIERVPQLLASQGAEAGKRTQVDARYGPTTTSKVIRLRAVTNPQGLATTYEHWNAKSYAFEPALPWSGAPLLDALMAANRGALHQRLWLKRYDLGELTQRIGKQATAKADFVRSPQYAEHAIVDRATITELKALFKRNPGARSCAIGNRFYIRVGALNGKASYFEVDLSNADGNHQILRREGSGAGRDTGLFVTHSAAGGWVAASSLRGGVRITSAENLDGLRRLRPSGKGPWIGQEGGYTLPMYFDLNFGNWLRAQDRMHIRYARDLQDGLDESLANPSSELADDAIAELREELKTVLSEVATLRWRELRHSGRAYFDAKGLVRSSGEEMLPAEREAAMRAFGIEPTVGSEAVLVSSEPKLPLPAKAVQFWFGPKDIPEPYFAGMRSIGDGLRSAYAGTGSTLDHRIVLGNMDEATFARMTAQLNAQVPGIRIVRYEDLSWVKTPQTVEDSQAVLMVQRSLERGWQAAAADVGRFQELAHGGGHYYDMDNSFNRAPTLEEVSVPLNQALLSPGVSADQLELDGVINNDNMGFHANSPIPSEVIRESWRRFEANPQSVAVGAKPAQYTKTFAGPQVLSDVLHQSDNVMQRAAVPLDPVSKSRMDVYQLHITHGVIPTDEMLLRADDVAGMAFVDRGGATSWAYRRR